jgi:hypothetical protein
MSAFRATESLLDLLKQRLFLSSSETPSALLFLSSPQGTSAIEGSGGISGEFLSLLRGRLTISPASAHVVSGRREFWGESICIVTMIAGTRKMIVTQIHIRDAASC